MGFFTNLLNSTLSKTASKADDTSSPGDDTTITEDMGSKKSEPFGGKKAPPFGSKKEASDKGASKDEALQKIAAETLETKKFIDKVAKVLHEDAGPEDEALYRNCASAVVHLKLAGRIKPEFDTPKALAEMAYHLYEDILANG